jgi:hypothetical protein
MALETQEDEGKDGCRYRLRNFIREEQKKEKKKNCVEPICYTRTMIRNVVMTAYT